VSRVEIKQELTIRTKIMKLCAGPRPLGREGVGCPAGACAWDSKGRQLTKNAEIYAGIFNRGTQTENPDRHPIGELSC
jgi:hypothetical protein